MLKTVYEEAGERIGVVAHMSHLRDGATSAVDPINSMLLESGNCAREHRSVGKVGCGVTYMRAGVHPVLWLPSSKEVCRPKE